MKTSVNVSDPIAHPSHQFSNLPIRAIFLASFSGNAYGEWFTDEWLMKVERNHVVVLRGEDLVLRDLNRLANDEIVIKRVLGPGESITLNIVEAVYIIRNTDTNSSVFYNTGWLPSDIGYIQSGLVLQYDAGYTISQPDQAWLIEIATRIRQLKVCRNGTR